MTAKPFTATALLCSVLLCAAPAMSAQPRQPEPRPRTAPDGQALSDLAAILGPHVVRQWRRDEGIAIETPETDIRTSRQIVEKLFADQERLRGAYDTARNTGQFLAQATGLAGLQVLVAAGNDEIERAAGLRVRQLLKEHKPAILEAAGLTYEALRQSGPEEIRKTFADNAALLQEVRDRYGLEPEPWNVAMELLVDAVVNSTERQIDRIETYTGSTERLGADVAALAANLHGLEIELDTRLRVAEEAMPRIADTMRDFQAAVVDLDDRLANVETNQAVVADFIFDSMPAARKVDALQAGFMRERFACADGGEACDAAALKTSLLDRFQKEAELDALVGEVASVTGAVNDVYAVATNLGIDSPELNDLMRYGNAAAGAFTQFATGNVLGALASVTSVFGRRRDADAERFAAMMGYLNREFTRINLMLDEIGTKLDRISAKIDRVLENQALIVANQARLMDAMAALSEQMQSSFMPVYQSLGRLEFEQERLSAAVRSLIWDDWKTCHAVYQRAVERNADGTYAFINPDTLLLTSERHLQRIVSTAGETLVLPCIRTMQGNFASLNALERFGNFIDLDWVVANRLDEAVPEFPVDPEEWRTRLDAFKRDVFAPALAHAVRFVDGRAATSFAGAFAALTRPVVSTDDWRATAAAADAVDFACWDPEQTAHERLFPLLCDADAGDPNANARRLLERPILADVVNDVADWVLLVAQFADLRDQRQSGWSSYRELFDAARRGALDVRSSAGEDLIARSIPVLDVAIASYAMIYGPMGADRIVADVESGTIDAGSITALRQNPFLAANTIQLLLEERYRARFGDAGRARPAKTAYRAAYELALSERSGRFVLLEGLFGDDLTFQAGEDGAPRVVLQAGDESAAPHVPTPAAFTEGRLLLPPRYYELLAARARLVDRLYEYRMLDDFEGRERTLLGVSLTQ